MSTMKKNILLTLLLFFGPLLASAAVVSVYPTGPVPVGGTKVILISLDTEGEQINTLEGEVAVPEEFLSVKSVQDGDSVVGFWTETPSASGGVIHFSGIIPGGFTGRGTIARIIVSGVQPGLATVRVPNFTVFLNDGEGVPQEARTEEKTVEVIVSGDEVVNTEEVDRTPPESFSVVLIENDEMFEGKRVLIFATQDQQSGMSHYEVQETDNDVPNELLWVRGESPFILPDESAKNIFVRATDNAGNSTVVRYDGDARSPLERALYTLVFLALVVLLMTVLIRRKHHHYARMARTKTSEGN